MDTYTTTAHRPMPKSPETAKQGVRHVLADLGVRPPGFNFQLAHAATGRQLERVIICVPFGAWEESPVWFERLRDRLPWHCRVTVIPDAGRIEIEPRGR